MMTLWPNIVQITVDDLIWAYGVSLFQHTSKKQYLNNDMHMKDFSDWLINNDGDK